MASVYHDISPNLFAVVFDESDSISAYDWILSYLGHTNIEWQAVTKRLNPNVELNRELIKQILDQVWEQWEKIKDGENDELFKPKGVVFRRDRVVVVHATPGFPIWDVCWQ